MMPGSAVTVADDNRSRRRACEAILDAAWQQGRLHYHGEPLEQARARHADGGTGGGPILLLDHADNCASGATQDTCTSCARRCS